MGNMLYVLIKEIDEWNGLCYGSNTDILACGRNMAEIEELLNSFVDEGSDSNRVVDYKIIEVPFIGGE